MNLLKQYFKLQQEIYKYFGYVEEWQVLPIDDRTSFYWDVVIDEGSVRFSLVDPVVQELTENQLFEDELLIRPSTGSTYHSNGYTMIAVDTRTDGNKFLAIYDNTKQRHQAYDDDKESMT
jgi:hypothetical protein